jgi:hypothetical protein
MISMRILDKPDRAVSRPIGARHSRQMLSAFLELSLFPNQNQARRVDMLNEAKLLVDGS